MGKNLLECFHGSNLRLCLFLAGTVVRGDGAKTDGWFLCMVGKLRISFEFAVVECVFEAAGRAFR